MPKTAAQIDAYLKRKGSPMAGHGAEFVRIGEKYGIDPNLLVSISGAESSFGRGAKGFNPFGWGPHKQFNSWGQAIDTVAGGLKRGYFDKGLNTVEEIGARYAPANAANDPTGLNNNWTKNVNSFLGELGGGALPQGPAIASSGLPGPPRVAAPDMGLINQLMQSNSEIVGVPGLSADLLGGLGASSLPRRAGKPVGNLSNGLPVEVQGKVTGRVKAALQLAEEFIGTPYSWGGGGPGGPSKGFAQGANTVGFDCSSLLQYMWSKAGKSIPRTTYDQWKTGAPVGRGQLRPGDAVFFNMGANGPEHVGVYLGGGKFLEAPHTGAVVRVSRLAGRSDFAGGRRFG